jgi:transcriptional regulator with XRE-family HTH domain
LLPGVAASTLHATRSSAAESTQVTEGAPAARGIMSWKRRGPNDVKRLFPAFRRRRFVPRTPGSPPRTGMVTSASTLGNFIRDRRLVRGLSQRSFACLLGPKWSQGRVSQLELGRMQRLREPELGRIAVLLHVRPVRLTRLMPSPPPLLPPLTPLAKLIRSRREALKMSRKELARRAGMNHMYLGLLERRIRSVKYAMAARLSKALHLRPAVLAPFTTPSTSPPGSTLGAVIQRRRKELGLSAGALARRIGVGKPHVLAIERGTINLLNRRTEGKLARFARALGLDIAELEAVRPAIPVRSAAPAHTLGGYLARHRSARRWTQDDLARRAGVNAARLCYIEGNKARPSDRTLARLAQALDVSLDRLRRLRSRLPPLKWSAPAPPPPGSIVHARRRELERLAARGESLQAMGDRFGMSKTRAAQMLRSLGLHATWAAVRGEMNARRRAEARRTWIAGQISPDLLDRIEAKAGPVEAYSRLACRLNGFRVLIHRCTEPHLSRGGAGYWKWTMTRAADRYLLAAPGGHVLILPCTVVRRLPREVQVRTDWQAPGPSLRRGPNLLRFRDRWDLLCHR